MGVAAEFSPEGTSGADLADFESAFGGVFNGSEGKRESAQSRFTLDEEETEEEIDESIGQVGGDQVAEKVPGEQTQNEKINQVEVDALAEIENKQKAAREKWNTQKTLKELQEENRRLKEEMGKAPKTPFEGKTGDGIIQMALAALEGNGDTPEEAEDKLKGKSMKEIAAIIKEELRQEMEAEKSERERISAEKQAEQDFKAQLTKVAESQAEKFPLVAGLGGVDHVYQMIVEDFDQKKKEFGEEYATENVMKASEAMKKVNELLENNVKDALKSESVRRFVMNALKDGSFDQSKGNNQNNGDQGASTLSNSLHRKVTDPVDMRSMTDEEAFEAAFNYLK